MRPCPNCGSKSYEKVGICTKCLDCSYILEVAKPSSRKLSPQEEEVKERERKNRVIRESNKEFQRKKTEEIVRQAKKRARQELVEETKRAEKQAAKEVQLAVSLEREVRKLQRREESKERQRESQRQKRSKLWAEWRAREAKEGREARERSGAHVDKSVPNSPDGIVMIDKRGVQYRVQSGRKRVGEWRNCIDCGKSIYVRSYRKGATRGKRCAPCNRKVYLPPVRVHGKSLQEISKVRVR